MRGLSSRSGRRPLPIPIRCDGETSLRLPQEMTVSWDRIDSIPFEDGLIKRKDVYSDSASILRQVGLLD